MRGSAPASGRRAGRGCGGPPDGSWPNRRCRTGSSDRWDRRRRGRPHGRRWAGPSWARSCAPRASSRGERKGVAFISLQTSRRTPMGRSRFPCRAGQTCHYAGRMPDETDAPARPTGAGAHYFTARPVTRAERVPIEVRLAGARRSRWSRRPACSAATGWTSAPGCCSGRFRAAGRPATCSTSAAAGGRSPSRWPCPRRGDRVGGRRQRAGARAGRRERRARSASATGAGACRPEDVPAEVRVRGDLVEPADPDRQGGPARAAAALAAAAARRAAQAHLVVQRHLGADSLHAWLTEALTDARTSFGPEREGLPGAPGHRPTGGLTIQARPRLGPHRPPGRRAGRGRPRGAGAEGRGAPAGRAWPGPRAAGAYPGCSPLRWAICRSSCRDRRRTASITTRHRCVRRACLRAAGSRQCGEGAASPPSRCPAPWRDPTGTAGPAPGQRWHAQR